MKSKLPISEIHALMQYSSALGWMWQRVEETKNVQWSLVQSETGTPLQVFAAGPVLKAETRAIAHFLPMLLENIVNQENVSAEAFERLEFVYLAFTALEDRMLELEQRDLHESFMLFNEKFRKAMAILKQNV